MIRKAASVFLFAMLVFATAGCLEVHKESLFGYFFYQGQEEVRALVNIPIIQQGSATRLTLLNKKISYRNNRKATIAFELPQSLMNDVSQMEIDLEAYNDDASYLRAIWFEVDGVGGYIGTFSVLPGQVRGQGTLAAKRQGHWIFDLASIFVAAKDMPGDKGVNFFDILRQPGEHTVTCWISTYEQYGPGSWVSLDLILKH